MKLKCSGWVFENSSNMKFHQNASRPMGSELISADGETDGQTYITKAYIRISQFCERRQMKDLVENDDVSVWDCWAFQRKLLLRFLPWRRNRKLLRIIDTCLPHNTASLPRPESLNSSPSAAQISQKWVRFWCRALLGSLYFCEKTYICMFWRRSANLFERTTDFGNVFDMVANEPRNSAGIVTSLRGGRPTNRDMMSDRVNKVPPFPTSRLAVELTELSTKGVKNKRKVALKRPLKTGRRGIPLLFL